VALGLSDPRRGFVVAPVVARFVTRDSTRT
jgi:hypothetical protein